MSIKLHNLYRTTWNPFALIGELRPRLDEILESQLANLVVHAATRMYFNSDGAPRDHITAAWMEVLSWKKDSPFYPASQGLDFQIVFLPDRYFLVYTYNQQMGDLVRNFPRVSYTPYWDDCDQPDDVTQEAWEQRKADVERILSGSDVPSEAGLTWTHRARPEAQVEFMERLDTVRIDPWRVARQLAYYRSDIKPGELTDWSIVQETISEGTTKALEEITGNLPTIDTLRRKDDA